MILTFDGLIGMLLGSRSGSAFLGIGNVYTERPEICHSSRTSITSSGIAPSGRRVHPRYAVGIERRVFNSQRRSDSERTRHAFISLMLTMWVRLVLLQIKSGRKGGVRILRVLGS